MAGHFCFMQLFDSMHLEGPRGTPRAQEGGNQYEARLFARNSHLEPSFVKSTIQAV